MPTLTTTLTKLTWGVNVAHCGLCGFLPTLVTKVSVNNTLEPWHAYVKGHVSYTNVGKISPGSLTMPSSNKNNLSHKTPNEVIPVALESRIPVLSRNIWNYMVDIEFEGENLPRKCNDEHGINLY